MVIECVFKGKDSLGYKKGNKYTLRVYQFGGTFRSNTDVGLPWFKVEDITIIPYSTEDVIEKLGQRCEYSSMDTFISNWEIKNIIFDKSLVPLKPSQDISDHDYNKFIHPFKRYIRDKKLDSILSE